MPEICLGTSRQALRGYHHAMKVSFTRLRCYIQGLKPMGNQIGDERPLSCCAISPDGQLYATGGWGGSVKVRALCRAGCLFSRVIVLLTPVMGCEYLRAGEGVSGPQRPHICGAFSPTVWLQPVPCCCMCWLPLPESVGSHQAALCTL